MLQPKSSRQRLTTSVSEDRDDTLGELESGDFLIFGRVFSD